MCKNLDWQIDCAAQVCGALMPVLSGVEKLTLDFHKETMPTKWQNGEIDGTTWALSEELSRGLEVGEIGSDPGLLPNLQDLVSQFRGVRANNVFGSFVHTRQSSRGSPRPLCPTAPAPIAPPFIGQRRSILPSCRQRFQPPVPVHRPQTHWCRCHNVYPPFSYSACLYSGI
ncbi:hypothetical protein EDB85DRAFT_547324 [Lactarius pseudohatsudake]|nr:hypothetical protein EDB85DRAFT_547324 [Lactarius pseudohatsudake]